MLSRRLLLGCYNAKNSLTNMRKANFSNFHNPEVVEKTLNAHKGAFDKAMFEKVAEVTKGQEKVHLFKIYWFSKWFFIITRYQIIGYCIVGGLYAFYETFFKWQSLTDRENQKITRKERKEIATNKKKIVLGVTTLIVSGILACYVTHFMGKRLVRDIYWLPSTNQIQLNYFSLFCGSKPVLVDPKYIHKVDPPRRFDTTVRYQVMDNAFKSDKLLSTRGVGEWSNKDVFEYIIENTEKK